MVLTLSIYSLISLKEEDFYFGDVLDTRFSSISNENMNDSWGHIFISRNEKGYLISKNNLKEIYLEMILTINLTIELLILDYVFM